MDLAAIIRQSVEVMREVTDSLLVTVIHRAFKSENSMGGISYHSPVTRKGLLSYNTRMVFSGGREQASSAQLVFLEDVKVTLRDEITFPDWNKPPIIRVRSLADPGGGGYMTEVDFA
jgi:hypothetical protein